MLTQERLKELLHYNPETGIFTWKTTKGRMREGNHPGTITEKGYLRFQIDGKAYLSHRVAWLHVYGVFPEDQIDHINRIKDDNRITNLREATNNLNQCNMSKRLPNSSSKYRGVGLHKSSGKWRAYVSFKGKGFSLGLHNTPEDAAKAYNIKAKELFGKFAYLNDV